jgi:hypothetical protein
MWAKPQNMVKVESLFHIKSEKNHISEMYWSSAHTTARLSANDNAGAVLVVLRRYQGVSAFEVALPPAYNMRPYVAVRMRQASCLQRLVDCMHGSANKEN